MFREIPENMKILRYLNKQTNYKISGKAKKNANKNI